MTKIKKAKEADLDTLAHLARQTWAESHGHYIEDKNDLLNYLDDNFTVSKTTEDFNNPKNHFYIIYLDNLPVGYAKIVLNANQEHVTSQNNCRLERIFILNEFIPLKLGKQLLTFVEDQAKALQLDTMWLTVYIKNDRAIRFYEKNEFNNVGKINFVVSGKDYENIVFSKKI
ncbi:GNAT family N-acetyltransferase [Winogradskyella sp. R77965]|uniref:GNAT family N-acetyltransferase n=1 Tax=Winogradskyella sp. R77965 TaxID=3093872 RepID=UPI0037DDD21B